MKINRCMWWCSGNVLFLLLLLLCVGCKTKDRSQSDKSGATVAMRYAEQIQIDSCDGYWSVRVRNPWDTAKILHTYILVEQGRELPDNLPAGTLVRTPLRKSLIYSSVHCSLLVELDALDCIGGVCDLQYIYHPAVRTRCAEGGIVDAGNAMSPDLEKVIDLHPNAVLLSPFENSGGYGRIEKLGIPIIECADYMETSPLGRAEWMRFFGLLFGRKQQFENSGGYGRIEKLGIPIIECADYMETSPLGRAEWMRFFGLLFGRKQQADSLFAEVEKRYASLKALVDTVSVRPIVLSELRNGSAWYTPGGHSTIGRLYADAGAAYVWADDTRSGSVPLSFETVFDRGRNADFWLFKYNETVDKTLSSLRAEYAPYAGFRAFQTGRVFACNTGKVPFYEETPFRPDWLLKDLILVFHPECLPGETARYFKQLHP